MNNQALSPNDTSEAIKLNLLINYLTEKLDISQNSIRIARRYSADFPHQLPIILWQYGIIQLEQLNIIFDWLENLDFKKD
ncbi:MAG: hypothetical protein Kow0049_31520 [Stanieria sp.]|jgi:hypothetical protein